MSSKSRGIKIGLLGLGVVGSGVAQALVKRNPVIEHQLGSSLDISAVLVRDKGKQRHVSDLDHLLTTNPADVIDNPEIDIIVGYGRGNTCLGFCL